MTTRTITLQVSALCAALALAGCSGGGSSTGTGPTKAGAAPAAGASPAAASSAPAASAPAAAPTATAVAPLAPLAPERSATDERGDVVMFAPVALHRQGAFVVLEVQVRNTTPAGVGDDSYNFPSLFMTNSASFTAVSLVDGTNHKRHTVVTDNKDRCLCTSFFGGLPIPRGGSAVLTAYFAAPPAGVTAMDVVLDKRGSFPAIPVSG